jgi:hypothetical protein
MRQTIWTGTCAAIVSLATAGMFAQPPAQTPTPQTPTPQTSTPQTAAPQSTPSSSDNKVTVTGCLKAAPQATGDTASAATTAGTTGAATAGTTGTTGTTAAGTTGTTASAAAGASDAKFVLTGASATPADASNSAETYRLIANPTALTAHVGKKLELTGTIDKNSTADPKDPSASAPALRVESGKVLAASCSQ